MKCKFIGYFIDKFTTILPSDEQVGNDVANSLWYQYIKPLFDDKVWNDFYHRMLYEDGKFMGDDETILANIKKTLAIHIKSKRRIYERMFNAFMSDYNPLWNVDGVTGRITETTHTGTDTNVKTGTDTLTDTGGHSNVKSGSEDLDYTGKETQAYLGSETNTYNGKETNTYSGKETTDHKGTETHTKGGSITETESNTTFESATFYPTNKKVTDPADTDTLSFTGRSDEKSFTNRQDEKTFTGRNDVKSFTNRQDEKSFTNRTDTHQYNNVTDTFSYAYGGEKHTTQYNSQDAQTRNLLDKDIEMIIRQGNIGVTKSSELLADTLALYGENILMDFVYYVVHDCINQVCSMLYY